MPKHCLENHLHNDILGRIETLENVGGIENNPVKAVQVYSDKFIITYSDNSVTNYTLTKDENGKISNINDGKGNSIDINFMIKQGV